MNKPDKYLPLLAIVGETATGKSALAVELALKYNGEIIAADSRTIYKGMDIGTAKPSKKDQRKVRHHLLDLVYPDQPFTVADFKRLATNAITEICSRGKLPIMVGGSGLYIDSVLFDYKFSEPGAEKDPINLRHLRKTNKPDPAPVRVNTLILGLKCSRDKLEERIRARAEAMLAGGLIEEVDLLGSKYGWKIGPLQTPAYKAFGQYINGEISSIEAKELFIRNDMNLAKRQRTWFKRNKSIHWLHDSEDAYKLVAEFLNNQRT